MNPNILHPSVQAYIDANLKAKASQLALAKSAFENVSSTEIAGQVAAKQKSFHKLPSWYQTPGIYFPPLLSIEQCSSEITAAYKANLVKGEKLIDLTAGFGVDSYYFSKKVTSVVSCEINTELSAISSHNASILHAKNIQTLSTDGIGWLKNTEECFDTIYIDPARRLHSNKVFKLQDCTPDVVTHLPLLLNKVQRVIIKSAPLLDLSAGLSELNNVSEIHIVSVKNECKELLWIIDKDFNGLPQIVCSTLNERQKTISFPMNKLQVNMGWLNETPSGYLYEPDVALLKSGAFNLIAQHFEIKKLHQHTHLYISSQIKPDFPGRIFSIESVLNLNELKKTKGLTGNVIVRNFPERAENLVKKYKIKADHDSFIIFTQGINGFMAIMAKIIQHY